MRAPLFTEQNPMRFASLFSGIDGFAHGFEAAGLQPTFQAEINKHRRKVLADHWPDLPRGEDVRDVRGSDLGSPDLVVGGFPCKDISIGKGTRKGLDGARSALFWEFHRLVDEHLRLVDETRPRWALIENVPGLVDFNPPGGGRPTKASNDGRDMAAIVLGLEELGYGWAYTVVDGRSHGLAQRRPRVVILAHRGGDPRPAWMVLARQPAGRGDLAPGVRVQPAGEVAAMGPGGLVPSGVDFARKSARPTTTADKGGFSSWVRSNFFNVLNPNDGLYIDKHDEATLKPVKQTHLIYQFGRVRVPTRLEWERLMGFPDHWTRAILDDANAMYSLGDSFAPPVAKWLGEGLIEVSNAIPMLPELDRRLVSA